MADNIAVSVRDVSKKYRLFSSAKDRLKEALHPFRRPYHRDFWALDGISADIPKGQTLGIIGRNGSGKSTLLQIITGVLQPTRGDITVNGRVAALLELGTGFNPEFTGRENVLLSGSIMGISRGEMLDRMPAIEAFADIGEFFDQPVKVYSSGMFVRVAFASAINVDPDILIVDEALAVGDAKFQHKCFERFADFQKRCKTIIFVSHNVGLVSSHCQRVMLLDGGRLVSDGEPTKVVDRYLDILFGCKPGRGGSDSENSADGGTSTERLDVNVIDDFISPNGTADVCRSRRGYNPAETRIGDRSAEIIDYLIATGSSADQSSIRAGASIKLLIKVKFHRRITHPIIGFALKTVDGIEVYGTNTYLLRADVKDALQGDVRVFQFDFPARLKPGDYFVDLGVAEVDGTPGGSVVDLRRSVVHAALVGDDGTFTGLMDLLPTFSALSTKLS